MSKPFVNLQDKLTRLRIRGHWSDPAGKLIKKEPVKDVKEGTVGFLRDVIKSGGELSQQAGNTLRALFDAFKIRQATEKQ